jgi:hypothetical protein
MSGRGGGGNRRTGGVRDRSAIWLEPSLNRLDGVVHGRVDHGEVECAGGAWPRSSPDGLRSELIPIDHDISAGRPCRH